MAKVDSTTPAIVARLQKQPWWIASASTIGLALMSAFGPDVVPVWATYMLFGLGLILFLVGAATGVRRALQHKAADPEPERLPPPSIERIADALANGMHATLPGVPLPRPGTPRPSWVPLDHAIRFIANESQWGVDHDQNDPNFYVNLGIHIRDALACGDMAARGRKFHTLRGGIKDPPLHPLIPIPRDFWEDSFIDAWWPLNHGGPVQTIARRGSTVKKGDHEGMHDIRLDEHQVRALWPPAKAVPPKAEPARIPFAALRDIAMEYGLSLDHRDPAASNVAYALEGALKEAAANSRMPVWGRPYNGHVRDNDPLVAIPPAHFLKYSFRHGALHHVMRNRDICTTTIPLVAAKKEELEGETFYDLHVSTAPARSVIKCFADERAGDEQ